MDPEGEHEATTLAAGSDAPSKHIVVLFDAELPEDLLDQSAGHDTTTTLDLRVATIDQLNGLGPDAVRRVTLVVPGWSQLRLACTPARLLPETRDLHVRMTEDSSHVVRRMASSGFRMKGLSVAWSSTAAGQLDLRFTASIPRSVNELLGAAIGWDVGPLHVPLRVAISDRSLEPFVVGNPHVRYTGVDDVLISAGAALSAVDLVLERATVPAQIGAGPPNAMNAATLRVLSEWRGGVLKLHESGADPALTLPPVDTWLINPSGFEAHDGRRAGRTVAAEDGTATAIADQDGATVFTVRSGAALTKRQIRQARRLRFIRTVRRAHESPLAEARLLTQLAAAGVPIVARGLSPAVSRLLGDEMVGVLAEITPALLADPLMRELASVRLRRAALRNHGSGPRARRVALHAGMRPLPEPLVSVVLVTKRPVFLRGALEQIARQTWGRLEVVLGLHGDEFSRADVKRAVRGVPHPITVIRIPAQRAFGEALNEATTAASGTYVTKWDDDDLYGADHVWDLMLAADYSGATVVGKGREFILLDDLRTIVRGTNRTSERMVRFVAGGTLLFQRRVLEEMGGWRPIPAAVDRAFLRQVLDAGGSIYRTHGFGYILRRHAHGHTWAADNEYFLGPAVSEWAADSWIQNAVLDTSLAGPEAG